MQWDDNNGDRKRILTQAEIKFRERIAAAKEANNTITPQLLDYLQSIGIDIHNREEMIQYLKEHGNKAIQEAIATQQEMQDIKAKAIAEGTFMKAPNGKDTNLTERQWLQVRTKAFKNWFGDWEKYAKFAASFVNNNNILTIKENEYTDEFRRIQEESRSLLPEKVSTFHKEGLPRRDYDNLKRSLGTVYAGLLSRGSSRSLGSRSLTSVKHGTTFNILQINGSLFHDIFEINRNYLQNGELVDLHETYDNCKCYLSDDGLCGFAIEPDGNLVSVFSLNPSDKKGFLYAIKDFITEEGATHLDAYASKTQNLELIYAKTLGFHTASEMDYNMEYDHDDIAKNHGKPKVVFMVNQPVERKSFDKDSYDDAADYAKSQIKSLDTNVSKVVDENGEPLVVYRGERGESKNILDTNKYGYTFFVLDSDVADTYNNFNNITRSFFLNIKNPKYTDGQNRLWDDIPLEGVPEDDWEDYKKTTTQKIAKNLINEGFDGGIIERIVDFGPNAIHAHPSTDFIITDANQAKSATDNNGDFSTLNDNIQMAISRSIYNSDLNLSEKRAIRKYIESLSKETDTSRGLYYINEKTGFIYRFNTSLVQYNDNRADGRDGFEILEKYDITHLNKQDRDNIENGLKRTKQSISSIITQLGLSQRSNDDSIIIIDYGEGETLSSTLDQQPPTSNRRSSDRSSQKNQRESFFITPQGEVYAFAAPNGNLYFDETVISSEHPIHEYTHLWDRVVAKNNPQLWQRGITLMKETSLWKEVEDESNAVPALFYFFKKSTNILFLIIRHLTAYYFSQERRKNNSYYKVTKNFTIFAENKRYEKKTG